MRVRVRFFAGTRDAVGVASRDVDAGPAPTVGGLFETLAEEHPRLARYRGHALLALNGAFVPETTRLSEGDEVVIMPPVSGGQADRRDEVVDVPAVDPAPFSLDALVAGLDSEGAGAVVAFEGLVRDSSAERPGVRVARLDFEAYLPLAERVIEEVRGEAISKFGLVDARVRHRTGTLTVGEPIVAVVVSAAHRAAAFEAAAWIMTELKTRVPIWKREVDEGDAHWWVNDPPTGRPGTE